MTYEDYADLAAEMNILLRWKLFLVSQETNPFLPLNWK